MKKIYLILSFSIVIGNVNADMPLEGEYRLAGPLEYQGNTKPGKSHLYITMTNDSAKKLFNSFEGAAVMDECTGMKYKSSGYVMCYEVEPGKKYFCSFSIDMQKNTVSGGLGGCF